MKMWIIALGFPERPHEWRLVVRYGLFSLRLPGFTASRVRGGILGVPVRPE